MLGKLLKHEYKATARTYLALYAGMLAVAIFTRIMYFGGTQFSFFAVGSIAGLTMTALGVGAIAVATIILTTQRFKRNLLGDEGYLMFTLPVTTDGLLLSKLIVAVSWFVAGIVMALVALSVAIPAAADTIISELEGFVIQFTQDGATGWSISGMILLHLGILALIAAFVLSIYAAHALAMRATRFRGLASFGIWLLIWVVAQVAGAIGLRALEALMMDARYAMENGMIHMRDFQTSLAVFLFCVVGSTVLYLVTRVMLKKNLNLE